MKKARRTMIDMATEKMLTPQEAARSLPPLREGKAMHPATITRWITEGLSGVKLEAIRVGNRWLTSAEALQRFAEALTEARETAGV